MVMGQKILLIDDSREIRVAQGLILETAGFDVVCAATGDEGCRILLSEPIDLIITDLMMSHGDGIQVAIEAKKLRRTPPIVMITGGGERLSSDDAVGFSQAFFDAYLQKPFSADQLLTTVHRFLM